MDIGRSKVLVDLNLNIGSSIKLSVSALNQKSYIGTALICTALNL